MGWFTKKEKTNKQEEKVEKTSTKKEEKTQTNATKKTTAKTDKPAKVEQKKQAPKKAEVKKPETKKTDSKKVESVEKETRKGPYRVVYDKEDRSWKIKRDGAKRVIDSKATKEEALKRVKELSESKDVGFVVHKKDGKFQKK